MLLRLLMFPEVLEAPEVLEVPETAEVLEARRQRKKSVCNAKPNGKFAENNVTWSFQSQPNLKFAEGDENFHFAKRARHPPKLSEMSPRMGDGPTQKSG